MRHLLEYLDFSDLSGEAAERAIQKIREKKYEGSYGGDDTAEDAIDDDALFEPDHQEMSQMFGDDYYEDNGNNFMIANDRTDIGFVGMQDQNYYLHCAKALNVTNDNLFFRWLEIPTRFWPYISYTFKDSRGSSSNTSIEFAADETWVIDYLGEESLKQLDDSYLPKAEEKFNKHIRNILFKISDRIDDAYEDDGIIDTIERFDLKFTEDGEIDTSKE